MSAEREKIKNISRENLHLDICRYGTKYGIQKLFCEVSLCPRPTKLLTPQSSWQEIQANVVKLNRSGKGVIVRFSNTNSLNLPRGFFKDPEDALKFIKANWSPDRGLIIQEFQHIKTSFELLYNGENGFYLQALPGQWELDAPASPDIIQQKDNKVKIWRYTSKRDGIFVDDDNKFFHKEVEPRSFLELKKYYQYIQDHRAELEYVRQLFNPKGPIFCHFIEADDGTINFINLRDVNPISLNIDSPTAFYQVENLHDVANYTEGKPILFDVKTAREEESGLKQVIQALKKTGIKSVYVSCGILSHPAILLREAGLEVLQAYDQSYETKEVIIQNKKKKPIYIVEDNVEPDPKITNDFILKLSDLITDKSRDLLGNKAYILSLLLHAGFPVPDGPVLTTKAYDYWEKIQLKNKERVIPKSLIITLLEVVKDLLSDSVAVRSSADIEDMLNSSSAGVFHTSLNVNTPIDLLEATFEGFKSMKERGHIALLIYPIIDADSSGVIFTKNPKTGARELVVNSTIGMCEPILSGSLPGDLYILNTAGEILTQNITSKYMRLTKKGEIEITDQEDKMNPSLSMEQLHELAILAMKIEKFFKAPQDIEFAIKDKKIWILQSRPITT